MKSIRLLIVLLVACTWCAACGGGSDTTGTGDPAASEGTVPNAPATVTITAGDGQVTLSWDAVADATSYTVYWKNTAGVTTTDTAIANATSPYVHSGLTNGTAYYYAIAAINAVGPSMLSNEVSATPQVPIPGVPQNVSATTGSAKVTIGWDAVAGATSYNIYWSLAAGVTPATGTKIAGAVTPYVHDGLIIGTTYYYVMTAINAGGESPASAQVSAVVADYPQRRAFVTSTTGDGILGLWAEVGASGKTGLAAADEICKVRAETAGLTGTFKAWLSDDTDDAYCRIHELTGTIATNCGQAALPATAGPWIRMDGQAFAEIDEALVPSITVYTPVRFNELGIDLNDAYYFTATDVEGNVSGNSCANWTSNSNAIVVGAGSTEATGSWWTAWQNGFYCDDAGIMRLLCLETGRGGALSMPAVTGKRVFVSSTTTNGNLGGLAGADATCQTLATNVGLVGTFIAILSDSTDVSTYAVNRITSVGPFVRLDGIQVAATKADLFDGRLNAPINLTETMAYVSPETFAWTASDSAGAFLISDCNKWSDGTAGQSAQLGVITSATDEWLYKVTYACNQVKHLYCIEN